MIGTRRSSFSTLIAQLLNYHHVTTAKHHLIPRVIMCTTTLCDSTVGPRYM